MASPNEPNQTTHRQQGSGTSGATDKAQEKVSQTADAARAKAGEAADTAREKASQAADTAREQAQKVAGQAQEQAYSRLDQGKQQAAGELNEVASAFRKTGEQLRKQDQRMVARYTEQVANQIDSLSSYIETKDVDEMVSEAEDMARRQPELFLGGAFTLGLVLARFLKSSSRRRHEQRAQQYGQRQYGTEGAAYMRSGPYDAGRDRMPYPHTSETSEGTRGRDYATGTP